MSLADSNSGLNESLSYPEQAVNEKSWSYFISFQCCILKNNFNDLI